MAYSLLLVGPLAALIICVLTHTWTTLRYRLALRNTKALHEPAPLPYTIPWLGSAQEFLNPKIGSFFTKLSSWHPREAGACTVLLGGERLNIVYSPTAVNAMFKLKNSVANRDAFGQTVMTAACGMLPEDFQKYGPNQHKDHQISQEFLLRQSNANELAWEFIRCFTDNIRAEVQALRGQEEPRREVDLYAWLKPLQFASSCTALMGNHIMQAYPDFAQDFVDFDRGFLDLVFGFPRLLKPKAFAARDKATAGLTRWIETADREAGSTIPDARTSAAWDPHWGSRCSRARQALWEELGLSPGGRASMELGFVFGLNSNAIPITSWMLMHILDPQKPDLRARVLAEIEPCATTTTAATGADGALGLDIQRLAGSPLMQSIFHETLRLYTDVLVTRELFEDVALPLGDTKEQQPAAGGGRRQVLLRKGTRVIAPTLMNHWDSGHFSDPPAHVFSPDRYLVPADPARKTKKASGGGGSGDDERVFSSAADDGRVWPWGGGKTICPGRLFAKQEVMAAVAVVLLSFDIAPVDDKSYKIPGPAEAKPGTGGLAPGGDVKVWIRPKSQAMS